MNRYVDHANDPHAVYRVYEDDGTLLYVGCTWNPEQRLKQHTWAKGLRVELAWYDSRTDGRSAESQAIRTERPTQNYRMW